MPRTLSVLKAAVSAGSTSLWSDAYDTAVLGGAFIDAIRSQSIFDTITPFSQHAQFRIPTGFSPNGATGSKVDDGSAIPVEALSFTKKTVEPIKIAAIVAATNEILSATQGNRWLSLELGRALVRGQNNALISGLTTGVTPTASTSAAADIKAALQAIAATGSHPVLVLDPKTAAAGATIDSRMFRDLTPTGGSIAGVPCVVADTTQDSAGGHDIIAIDAARLLTAEELPVPFVSTAGTVQLMDDPGASTTTPTGGTTNLVSLFQAEATAIRLSRRIGWETMRSGAVAVISGAQW